MPAQVYETVVLEKFLENKGHGFDGCDAVRLYDYLIRYEEASIGKNIEDVKRILWFVWHMYAGSYVYYRLKEDQKRTWAEFKQNLLEEYKKEEQIRMSCAIQISISNIDTRYTTISRIMFQTLVYMYSFLVYGQIRGISSETELLKCTYTVYLYYVQLQVINKYHSSVN